MLKSEAKLIIPNHPHPHLRIGPSHGELEHCGHRVSLDQREASGLSRRFKQSNTILSLLPAKKCQLHPCAFIACRVSEQILVLACR